MMGTKADAAFVLSLWFLALAVMAFVADYVLPWVQPRVQRYRAMRWHRRNMRRNRRRAGER